MKRVLIFGACSAIAEATARRLAARGDRVFLAARNAARVAAIAADLSVRGRYPVNFETLDANDVGCARAADRKRCRSDGGLDTVLIAHGTLPDQKSCEASVHETLAEIRTNALSVIALATLLANRFELQKSGTIAVISSVAGDRGRESNYVYGSAKALVSTFLSGLRQRLARSGVTVLTIKPGFVDTPMTADFAKGVLWATPQDIATGIVRAIDGGRRSPICPGSG